MRPRLLRLLVVVPVGLVFLGPAGTQSYRTKTQGLASAQVVVTPDGITWGPMPPSWADGPPPPGYKLPSEVAVLEGDPTRVGMPFVLRIRSKPGNRVPPHWHEQDENITVLSGTFCLGMGDTFDENACRDLTAGSYALVPKGMHHFALTKGDVIQVHGIGPFRIHFVRAESSRP